MPVMENQAKTPAPTTKEARRVSKEFLIVKVTMA